MKNKKEFLMMEHKELVRTGKFQEARKLLDFLIDKRIVLTAALSAIRGERKEI